MPSYRETLFERLGDDGPIALRAIGLSAGFAVVVAAVVARELAGGRGALAFLLVLVAAWALVVTLAAAAVVLVVSGGAAGFMRFLHPSGSSTPAVRDFSLQDAMVMRGDVRGALESYEAVIATDPGASDACIRAAELYAKAGDFHRARDLLREARTRPGVTEGQELHATQALVDHYLGPLDDEAAAGRELRRIAERFPGTAQAEGALRALRSLDALPERRV